MTTADKFGAAAVTAWKKLRDSGYEAYLIGGSVRDFIMGRAVGDIDITTNAVPERVKRVFDGFKVIETGIKHGTVTVMVGDEPVEITTYRSEAGYSDNRHPDSVSFSDSLSDDVGRRDFTMNGIAYDFDKGFCDLVGGTEDIKNGIIRCIGNAEERFHEDALRILRAVRFSAVLGFEIEEETKKAIHGCRELLKNISAERIREEAVKLLCGENAGAVLTEFYDVIGVFIPEILPLVNFNQQNRHHSLDAYTHTIRALEQSDRQPLLRLALLFHDIGKPRTFTVDGKGEGHFYGHPAVSAEMADGIMRRLRFDNHTRESVVGLIRLHDTPVTTDNPYSPDRRRIRRIISQLGEPLTRLLTELKRCDNLAHSPRYVLPAEFYGKMYETIDSVVSEGDCLSIRDLAINGNDLMKTGLSGRQIGEALKGALNAVLDGQIPNTRDALINFIKK